jgi:hypothetical protein
MLRTHTIAFFVLTASFQVLSQTPPPPQTARQAVIEMFMGKSPDAFEKHLPEAARHALIHKSDSEQTSLIRRLSSISRELGAHGQRTETFDSGPVLLSMENPSEREKIQIMVERDDLMGEVDEIEISLQDYKDGELTPLPVTPRVIFTMKQEKDIWRLNDATLAVHAPLGDPEYLKVLTKLQNDQYEMMARMRISSVGMMEKEYAKRHPELGYSCKLADLSANERQGDDQAETPVPFNPEAAKEVSDGFRLTISGCAGAPVLKFKVTVVPEESDSGMKAFCADESDTVRFASDGTAASCLSSGELLKSEEGFVR